MVSFSFDVTYRLQEKNNGRLHPKLLFIRFFSDIAYFPIFNEFMSGSVPERNILASIFNILLFDVRPRLVRLARDKTTLQPGESI